MDMFIVLYKKNRKYKQNLKLADFNIKYALSVK